MDQGSSRMVVEEVLRQQWASWYSDLESSLTENKAVVPYSSAGCSAVARTAQALEALNYMHRRDFEE